MPVYVNTNVSSINAQRNLTKVGKSYDTAMQRLSSGLRINSAADDAAGLAISTGIDAQTNGLTQAERNANDGLSVVGTAEGAMTTQTSILQRIRELAVQAANDTNSADNRTAIQTEINAQVSELTRLGNTTTFNGINLMDGSFSAKQLQVGAYASQTISMTLGDFRASGMGATATVTGAVAAAGVNQIGAVDAVAFGAATVAINTTNTGASVADGVSFANATSSALAKANAINSISSTTGVTATANAAVYNAQANVTAKTAVVGTDSFMINGKEMLGSALTTVAGDTNGALTARINSFTAQTGVTASLNGSALVLTAADGRNITTSAVGQGISMSGVVAVSTTATGTLTLNSAKDITVSFGGAGVAANLGFLAAGGQNITIASGNMTSMSVLTQAGASAAIQTVDSALKTVSTAQSNLGALSNRLTNTISNIEVANENLSSAQSRILDADFAAETANMTRANIIQQSSVSVLTQANSRPQIALTLLKG